MLEDFDTYLSVCRQGKNNVETRLYRIQTTMTLLKLNVFTCYWLVHGFVVVPFRITIIIPFDLTITYLLARRLPLCYALGVTHHTDIQVFRFSRYTTNSALRLPRNTNLFSYFVPTYNSIFRHTTPVGSSCPDLEDLIRYP